MRESFIQTELQKGVLHQPFRATMTSHIAYYLVYDESAILQRMSRRFRDWITTTAARENNEYPV